MRLEKKSPCKVNLLLNILGKRDDGFHELETVMQPVKLFDELIFERGGKGIQLTCSENSLPADSKNLVHRAATAFLSAAQISAGVKIHLEKKIPLAAGLGGGSGNAATTLLGLNELFGNRFPANRLYELAATLGSDVPFFLQKKPALATGRGEKIQPLEPFPGAARQGVSADSSRLWHLNAVGIPKLGAISDCVEWQSRPREKLDFDFANRRLKPARGGLLQLA